MYWSLWSSQDYTYNVVVMRVMPSDKFHPLQVSNTQEKSIIHIDVDNATLFSSLSSEITFDIQRIDNVVMDQLKVLMTDPMFNVPFTTSKEIVRYCDFMSF